MRKFAYFSFLAGLSWLAIGLSPNSVNAQSQSDISGTNIWNNVAPITSGESGLDPALVSRIRQLNAEAEQTFQDCNAAIVIAEQQPTGVRRFSRRPNQIAIPAACQRLNTLRGEMETLRTSLQNQPQATSTDFFTW
ncbi:MAG: hypothetical protein WBG70_11385 [Spirulinaceae cyanobacterium]